MEILYIDACPRKASRTRELADHLLTYLDGQTTRVNLAEVNLPVIGENEANQRFLDKQSGDFSASIYDLSHQFAKADCIVIAAPFWDLSFPAILKKYIEAITVSGITFTYSPEGMPIGLCSAKELYYVTTAGGPIFNEEFGYGYIKMMAQGMYGIPTCHGFQAENLDVIGVDPKKVLEAAKAEISDFFTKD